MDKLKSVFEAISLRNRILILSVALAAGAGIFGFVRWQHEQRFRPLYSALSQEDASAIIQKLKEGGVEYRILENGTGIQVAADQVAEIRLQMASSGLPKTGRIGFEIFDKNNFGATDFTEHVNYRRALEGELERSVMSLSEVEQARVHLTFSKDSVFTDSRQPAKASVLVRLRQGSKLAPGSVLAITHLLASAVEGLAPEAVSVLDMRGTLLSRPRRSGTADSMDLPETILEYQQQIERSLLAKINSTLEPLLGADKFRAAISVDCDASSGEQSEEVFDPTRSVMVSSQKSEEGSASNSASGVPGTPSSLPRTDSPVSRGPGGVSRRSENIAFQSSRTIRRTRLPQGALRRVSVSVLVDQAVRWEGSGRDSHRVLTPPSPEQIKIIRDVVAGAIAFNSTRGDQLIVETIPFESTLNAEPPATPGRTDKRALPGATALPALGFATNPRVQIGAAVAAVIALFVVIGIAVRRKRKAKTRKVAVSSALPAAPSPVATAPQVAAPSETESGERLLLDTGTVSESADAIDHITVMLREGAEVDAELYALALAEWVNEGSTKMTPTAAPALESPEALSGLRKAAIVLIALGEQASSNIVKHLPRNALRKVSEEINRLGDVPPNEFGNVIEEFHQRVSPTNPFRLAGSAFMRRILVKAYGPEEGERLFDEMARGATATPSILEPIRRTDPGKLARVIQNEHPQTSAMLLAQLQPGHAAEVLKGFPDELRVDIALRLARIDSISNNVTQAVAGRITQKLDSLVDAGRVPYQGVKATAELLNCMPPEVTEEILERLTAENGPLADTIRKLLFVFEDINKLDENAIREIMSRIDRKVLTVALKGTSKELQDRLLTTVSQRAAAMIKEDMDALGPIRIKDVQDAQQQVIAVVRELEKEGLISLRGGGDLYVS